MLLNIIGAIQTKNLNIHFLYTHHSLKLLSYRQEIMPHPCYIFQITPTLKASFVYECLNHVRHTSNKELYLKITYGYRNREVCKVKSFYCLTTSKQQKK